MSGTDKAQQGMTEEQSALYEQLTPLARGVCLNVLVGMDHVDAYYGAGGRANKASAKTYVSRLIKQNETAVAFMRSMRAEIVSDLILSKEEALKELSIIAKGSLQERNRISAIKAMSEMQGWLAPTRSQIEVPKGITHKYSPEDYKKAAEDIRGHFPD